MDAYSDALLTDLYQLTMLQAYYESGLEQEAVFEFFVRDLPPQRGFLLAGGLETVLDYLEGLRFTQADLQYLDSTGHFRSPFLEWLGRLRFAGDVDALAEGTPVFNDEPVLRVTAPLPQAQLVESRIINLLHLQTMVASKAARVVLAAPDKLLVDFGFRRAHGAEAGVLAARAAYLAGFDATATVQAGARYGIPLSGTMAHSFVQAHDDEAVAFERFAEANPDNVVLLIDTYDTEAAARKVVELAPRLAERGITVRAVRIDSGDLDRHAEAVRAILDEAGMSAVKIFASGNLDEDAIADLIRRGAPVEGFGVGTRLDTSSDAPYLDCAYKLEEYAGRARRKRSEGKATWPGRKQIFREYGDDGVMRGDVVTVHDEQRDGEPLIRPVMRGGQRIEASPTLEGLRARTREQLGRLPLHLRSLETRPPYSVEISQTLRALAERVDAVRDA